MAAASLDNMSDKHLTELGIDAQALRGRIGRRLEELSAESVDASFTDMDIPIVDKALISRCESKCAELGFRWLQPSDLDDRYLLNKHTLRDRSGVIEARQQEQERRAAERRNLS